jgi:tellurite resistance protein TerC
MPTGAEHAQSVGNPLLWTGFILLVLTLLALDLGVFHRKAHAVGVREALGWSLFWIVLALIFNAGVCYWFGRQIALEFLTGYLVEKALSVDNIFVFLVIFSYFAVPAAFQHRVLFFGILGALVMRGVFILVGATLLAAFHWMLYVFGALLVLLGAKMLVEKDNEVHPERNLLFRLFKRCVSATDTYRGHRFVVYESGRWLATPLLLVVVAIEATDVMFAIDSIPAVFAITDDPFVVYTSNVLAILGLRALFFALAGAMHKIHYLQTGLAFVLAFVGVKMLLTDVYKISVLTSLAIIALLLGIAVAASLWRLRSVSRSDAQSTQSVACRGEPGVVKEKRSAR